jgi:hypothetical protein
MLARDPKLVLLKWFYDIFLGITTRAVCGGSLIGGTKTLNAQIRWTRWFTYFEPSERNTLRTRENESCIVQALAFSLGCLEWPSPLLSSISVYLDFL